MFTVSDNANLAIREIMSRSASSDRAGLRIAATGDRASLSIAVSQAPQPGDTVHDAGANARLFIAEEAGELLADKTIDARTDESGRVQFVLDTPGG